MGGPVRDRLLMIRGMSPTLRPGRWAFVASEDPALVAVALGSFREAEGPSLTVPAEAAEAAGLPVEVVLRQVTLGVLSSLEGVGLTAAVASALADRGIACNMVAALRHDHAFVPEERAEEAVEVLRALAAG